MSVDHAKTDGTQVPLQMSPMPVVWGVCAAGEFWWFVQGDRYILRTHPLAIELYEGHYCDTHGMEGELLGISSDIHAALAWVCHSGPRPHNSAVQ